MKLEMIAVLEPPEPAPPPLLPAPCEDPEAFLLLTPAEPFRPLRLENPPEALRGYDDFFPPALLLWPPELDPARRKPLLRDAPVCGGGPSEATGDDR